MAKRSKSQTEVTINQIMDEAFKQILTIGFEVMSYTTLSEATGISRTGISHHFPKKTDFIQKLDERFGEVFVSKLDFSSVEQIEISWNQAFTQPKYRAILKLYFSLCGYTSNVINSFSAIEQAKSIASQGLGSSGEDLIDKLIGKSANILLQEVSIV